MGWGWRGLTAAAAVVSFVCYLAILYALLANFQQLTPPPLSYPLAPVSSPSAALFTLSQLPLSLHCKLHSQLAFMFAFYASDYPALPSLSPLTVAVTVSVAVPGALPPSTLTNCACA